MHTFDNGWYRVVGIQRNNAHYFFNDNPIHELRYSSYEADFGKIYPSHGRQCKRCIAILKAYSNIGLENRLI